MRYKTDKERKDSVVIFRLNLGERKRLEGISKATGLSFSGIFRLKVLGEVAPIAGSAEEIKAAVAEQLEIFERPGLSDAKKKELSDKLRMKKLKAKRKKHEAALKVHERETVKRFKGRRSA